MPLTVTGENYRDFSEPRFFECVSESEVQQIRLPVNKAHALVAPANGVTDLTLWKFDSSSVAAAGPTVIPPLNPAYASAGRWIKIPIGGGGSVNPTSTVIPYNNAGTFDDSPLSVTPATVNMVMAGRLQGLALDSPNLGPINGFGFDTGFADFPVIRYAGVDVVLIGSNVALNYLTGARVVLAETGSNNLVTQESGKFIQWGTGDPEGVVTGSVGALFLRTNGGIGSTFYVKETGVGNTGWAVK